MSKINLLFLFLLIFLTGCSFIGSSVDKTGSEEEIIKGEGLKVSVGVDDTWIELAQLTIEVKLENDGDKPITIRKEDISIRTVDRLSDGSQVFTRESLNSFYDGLFSSDREIILQPSQEISQSGVLELENNFFKDMSRESLRYDFRLSYDYETSFSNNVVIDMSQRELSISDQLSQAAPIKVKDLELVPRGGSQYELIYSIENPSSSQLTRASVMDLQFSFGGRSLICQPYLRFDSLGEEVRTPFNLDSSEKLEVRCNFDISNYEDEGPVQTTTSGSIEYEYSIRENLQTSLPSERRVS